MPGDPIDQFPDGFFQPQESTSTGVTEVLPQDQHFPPNITGVGTVDVEKGSVIRTDTLKNCTYSVQGGDDPLQVEGTCTYWKVSQSCECLKVTYLVKRSGEEEKLPDGNSWESCGDEQMYLVIVCTDESQQPSKKKAWILPWNDDYSGMEPFPDPPVKTKPEEPKKTTELDTSPKKTIEVKPEPTSSVAQTSSAAQTSPTVSTAPPTGDSDPPLMGPNPTLWGKIKWIWWWLNL